MRIDLSTRISQAAENESPVRRGSTGVNAAAARPELANDQARLSLDRQRMQALEARVNRLPEVRQEKIEALQRAIGQGGYDVRPDQVAESMVSGMIASSNLIR